VNLRPAIVAATKASSFVAASAGCTCYSHCSPALSSNVVVVVVTASSAVITDSSFSFNSLSK